MSQTLPDFQTFGDYHEDFQKSKILIFFNCHLFFLSLSQIKLEISKIIFQGAWLAFFGSRDKVLKVASYHGCLRKIILGIGMVKTVKFGPFSINLPVRWIIENYTDLLLFTNT